ncbi:hypothetical protein [Salimicrobium flavidum]|uniref:Uncharacterized protein n=1 Tax=Salimicrobium flavidum TaxID=570947 RepID=A0A1N7KT70_9BACI|nr:hypothetical protein [Salimicrobium flavidum]SIS64813.1 hypothetical protein SAMN05421687_1183 [Salimicrobium flavidum]
MGAILTGGILLITYFLLIPLIYKVRHKKINFKVDDNLVKKFPLWISAFALSLLFLWLSRILNGAGDMFFQFATFLVGTLIILGVVLFLLVRPINSKIYHAITDRL